VSEGDQFGLIGSNLEDWTYRGDRQDTNLNLRAQQALPKKMDSQQMMELLLKEMRAWREKIAAGTEVIQAETEATKARTKAMRENMGASREEKIELKPKTEVKALACQKMETHQEERKPTPPYRKPEAAQKDEVLKVDAEVMLVREPKKKRRRD
jgi:hypothetical protein